MKIVKENYRYYGKTKICVGGILRGEAHNCSIGFFIRQHLDPYSFHPSIYACHLTSLGWMANLTFRDVNARLFFAYRHTVKYLNHLATVLMKLVYCFSVSKVKVWSLLR